MSIPSLPVIPATAPPAEIDLALARKQRLALSLMAILLLGAGLGAVLVPMGGAVTGSGRVWVETGVKTISHPTGGTIGQIQVHDGQHVAKGQILARLDDRVSSADADFSALSVDQMQAQLARLEAEHGGVARIHFPDSLRTRTDADARRAMADENRLLDIRRQEWAGLMAQQRARIDQYGQEIAGYQAQIASLSQQRALILPERDSLRQLYERKLVTISRLNSMERSAVELDGTIASLHAQIAQAQARMAETREQAIRQAQSRRSDSGAQMEQLRSALNQQNIRRIASLDSQERTVLRAPWAGIVDRLAVTAVGDVVRPAEAIMQIVPDKDRLLIEAAINSADIDQLHLGQEARIRLSALNTAETPELYGRLSHIGASPVRDEANPRGYFSVRVEISAQDLARHGRILKAGMPAEIFIVTGHRSMLSYITKPLRDQVARAFNDS